VTGVQTCALPIFGREFANGHAQTSDFAFFSHRCPSMIDQLDKLYGRFLIPTLRFVHQRVERNQTLHLYVSQ
jgi:hypothetical protein